MTTSPQLTPDLWSGDFPGLQAEVLRLAQSVPSSSGRAFSEHWAERFAELIALGDATAFVSSPESILDLWPERAKGSWFFTSKNAKGADTDAGFEAEPGVIYALLHTRQGAGNREDYEVNIDELKSHPDFLGDYEDFSDSTYANFVYRTDLTSTDLARFAEERRHAATVFKQKDLIARINSGDLAPWVILSSAEELEGNLASLTEAKNSLLSAERSANSEQLDLATAVLTLGQHLLLGEPADVDAVIGSTTDRELQAQLSIRDYFFNFASGARSASQANAELRLNETLVSEAETLPEGSALRDHLLGDRGQMSYMATEKQGRRNVQVKKTVERGSLLGSELKTASRTAKAHLDSLRKALETLEARWTELNDLQLKVDSLTADIPEREAVLWAAGWPGAVDAVPAKSAE